MTDTETSIETGRLEDFDPGSLTMDRNVRSDAEASITPQFLDRIKATKGNLVPVLLMRAGDQVRVWDGARRTLACQRLGYQVHGIIVGDDDDTQATRRARIMQQMAINDDREGLTLADRAAAVLELFDTESMTVAGIAKGTGRPKQEIEAALAVARSETAAKATQRWDFLTLQQAATLAAFEDDPEALAALAKAAKTNPDQFDHVAQQCRDSAAERAQKAAATAELEAAGWKVADDWQIPGREGWHTLYNYVTADGEPITAETHTECPYRAVRIEAELTWPAEAKAAWMKDPANADYLASLREEDGLGPDEDPEVGSDLFDSDDDAMAAGWVVTWQPTSGYCTNPEEAGHKPRYSGSTMAYGSAKTKPEKGTPEAEKLKEERRALLRRNREWRAATTVRITHLKTLLSRKALAPKTLADAAALLIAEAIVRGEAQPEKMGEGHTLACKLLGITSSDARVSPGRDGILAALDKATPARRQVIALGLILAGTEGEDNTWGSCADVHTWQRAEARRPEYGNSTWHSGPDRSTRYLLFLETHTGYTLSELEGWVAHGKPATPAEDVDVAPAAGQLDTGDGDGEDLEAVDDTIEEEPDSSDNTAGYEEEEPPTTGQDEAETDTSAADDAAADAVAQAEADAAGE
jgi:ParB family chromosome partitioning protein